MIFLPIYIYCACADLISQINKVARTNNQLESEKTIIKLNYTVTHCSNVISMLEKRER